MGDIARPIRPADRQKVRTSILTLGTGLDQPQNPCHVPTPGLRSGASTTPTRRGTPSFAAVPELFKGRHFDREVIVLCVRWYLRFKLSYRDLVEMMEERHLSLAHTTIMRWVHHYTPEFERRWNRFAPACRGLRGVSTRLTSKSAGKWVYFMPGRSTARAEPWTSG